MIDFDYWRGRTESELAGDYLRGTLDTDAAWWSINWRWEYSPFWDKLCRAQEAICHMAWEENPPSLDQWHDESFDAIQALNAHVRGYRTTLQKQVYWLKREAIRKAMDRGLVMLRMVRSAQKCRTCEGTGEWHDWHRYYGSVDSEERAPERCRRRSGRGTVNLDFHECNVANRYTFHQPYDHTTPFASHEIYHLRPWPTEWQPNQPARKLPCEQVGELLDLLKARYWKSQPKYVHDIYTYMDVGSIEVAAGVI